MSYIVTVVYDGPPSHKRDRQINSAIYDGRRRRQLCIDFEGSGYGSGERDLSYAFSSALMARAAVDRVQKLDGVRAIYRKW